MTPLAIKNIILAVLAGAGAWVASALGGWDMALQALLAVMAIDIITGLLVALVWKKSGKSETGAADSRAMFKGLMRKVVIVLVVCLAQQIDQSTGLNGILRLGAILFFTGNEGLSVIENAGLMGVPMPAIIKNALEQLRKKGDAE
jgi:toxin secretion/phage lysis holin